MTEPIGAPPLGMGTKRDSLPVRAHRVAGASPARGLLYLTNALHISVKFLRDLRLDR